MQPEVEAWIAELVEQAPPLDLAQQALVISTFASPPDASTRQTRPDAA